MDVGPPVLRARVFDALSEGRQVWCDPQGVVFMRAADVSLTEGERMWVDEAEAMDMEVWLFRMPPKRRMPSWAPRYEGDAGASNVAEFPGTASEVLGQSANLTLYPVEVRPDRTVALKRRGWYFWIEDSVLNGTSENNSTGGTLRLLRT